MVSTVNATTEAIAQKLQVSSVTDKLRSKTGAVIFKNYNCTPKVTFNFLPVAPGQLMIQTN